MQKNGIKKRLKWGMPPTGYVHKDRLVVNSNYDVQMVNELLGLPSKQWLKNFQLGLARSSKKDHRLYAQIVSGKYDSAYRSHQKLHSGTDLQYSKSTHGQLANNYNHVQSDFIKGAYIGMGSYKKRTVPSDPVSQKHSRITPQQKQVSVVTQVKKQPKITTVHGNKSICTENRFQVLSDNIGDLPELDNLQSHTSRGICGTDIPSLVPTPDIFASNIPANTELSIGVDDMPMIDTEVSNNQVMGLSPTYVSNDTKVDDFEEIQEKCRQQIGEQFGCIPLDTFVTYKGPDVHWEVIPDTLEAHKFIRESGIPNFLGMKIPVKTNLNIVNWKKHLGDYFDQQLLDLIQFGFPLDFDRNTKLCSTYKNHASACEFASHVDRYIQEELDHGAIMGPFKAPPISLHNSPFMTRPKADSDIRRTIIDLSWPKGQSVNDGVGKLSYLGTDFLLKYPSVDSIIQTLNKLGPACSIFKVDISHAFRHIRIDPGDLDLLGLQHLDQYYLDLSLPFGYRLGSNFFQKLSDSIRYIMNKNGFPGLHNYLDDLIYCGLPSNIHEPYQFLISLLQDLGLAISQKKLCPPSTQVVCLGILFDTTTRTMSIPS